MRILTRRMVHRAAALRYWTICILCGLVRGIGFFGITHTMDLEFHRRSTLRWAFERALKQLATRRRDASQHEELEIALMKLAPADFEQITTQAEYILEKYLKTELRVATTLLIAETASGILWLATSIALATYGYKLAQMGASGPSLFALAASYGFMLIAATSGPILNRSALEWGPLLARLTRYKLDVSSA